MSPAAGVELLRLEDRHAAIARPAAAYVSRNALLLVYDGVVDDVQILGARLRAVCNVLL
jgi:hypothetical protein